METGSMAISPMMLIGLLVVVGIVVVAYAIAHRQKDQESSEREQVD
jgi:Tfp pilus assembly protein PilO